MRYAAPGEQGSLITLQKHYGNFINGEFVAPVNGNYFTNTSPLTAQPRASFPDRTRPMSIRPWRRPPQPLTHGAKPHLSNVRWYC